MKTLIIKDLDKSASEKMELTDIVNVLDKEKIDYQPIDIVNWKAFPYQPQVSFRIAWSSETNEIFLQYKVKENGIRGTYGQDKGALPYKDDCVEFFFSPGADSCYYNLELNCIGYGTLACHRPDAETVRYGDEVLSKIRRASSLGNEVIGMKEGEYEWT
ncbi:MAG: hypothetical protein HUJ92_06630, partial [Bacteroidales bacterium]|nr:hypothetical protein [Bacteroidales bacterium]